MQSFSDYWRAIAGFWSLAFDKGGSAPQSPPPPDPVKTLQAQALATPSIYTPTGSQVYSGDPSLGTYKRTDTLSPEGTQQLTLKNALASAMLGRANTNAAGLPAGPLAPGMDSPGTKAYWDQQKGLLDTVFDRQNRQTDQKLANQGLPMGSEAYTTEMDRQALAQNDAYTRAAQGAEAQGFGQELQARQQNYNELAAAMGGQQLGQSSVGATGGQSFVDPQAALDLQQAGRNQQYTGQLAGYNANVATNNATTGAGAGLTAAAIIAGF